MKVKTSSGFKELVLLGKATTMGVFYSLLQGVMTLVFWIPYSFIQTPVTIVLGITGIFFVSGFLFVLASKGFWKTELKSWGLL